MAMARDNSSARKRLFFHDPHCFWCGKLTVFSMDSKLKHDAATVDHLYSRLHPERRAARRGRGRLVLACNQCNKDRSNAETRGLMFIPKLEGRKVIAELTTITPLGSPAYKGSGSNPHRIVLGDPKPKKPKPEDYGWVDAFGELRPRDWEEYCKYFRERPYERSKKVTQRATIPRRSGLATIAELCGQIFKPTDSGTGDSAHKE
jgi:hypothetical protein